MLGIYYNFIFLDSGSGGIKNSVFTGERKMTRRFVVVGKETVFHGRFLEMNDYSPVFFDFIVIAVR